MWRKLPWRRWRDVASSPDSLSTSPDGWGNMDHHSASGSIRENSTRHFSRPKRQKNSKVLQSTKQKLQSTPKGFKLLQKTPKYSKKNFSTKLEKRRRKFDTGARKKINTRVETSRECKEARKAMRL